MFRPHDKLAGCHAENPPVPLATLPALDFAPDLGLCGLNNRQAHDKPGAQDPAGAVTAVFG